MWVGRFSSVESGRPIHLEEVIVLAVLLPRAAARSALAALRFRSDEFTELEVVVLRHELAVLRRQLARPELSPPNRVSVAAASRLLPRACWRSFVVTPTTSGGRRREDRREIERLRTR